MFRFIDREAELSFLERKFHEDKLQLIVIYGRRRVGKTELIKQFCKDKEHIYFLADKRGTIHNAERFANISAEHYRDTVPRAENFDDVFDYILKRAKRKRTVITIDEFSYLVERDKAIPSVFQLICDEKLKQNIMLILCGSSISMMVEGVLSHTSPLYGRRTGQWKMCPVEFRYMNSFFPGTTVDMQAEIYAVLGGIPLYLLEFDGSKDLIENIETKILTKGEILYEEVEILLREELREHFLYLSIFEAIARGNSRLVEIANYSKIRSNDMPKYLNTLIRLGLVEKEHPVTEREKTKKTIYGIKDNFFSFYFNFVYPNVSYVESGDVKKVTDLITNNFPDFMGKCFEGICKEFLLGSRDKLPFSFQKIGRQWGKFRGEKGRNTYEIDIVALNNDTKETAFFECKWKDLSRGETLKIIEELKKKAGYVRWNNDERKEYYGVIAKKIEGKDSLRRDGYLAFDLRDF